MTNTTKNNKKIKKKLIDKNNNSIINNKTRKLNDKQKEYVETNSSALYNKFENGFEKQYGKIIKNNKFQDQLIKEFNSPYAPNSIKPQDDYYTYINYNWLSSMKKLNKKTYYTQQDDFRIVQEKTYYDLLYLVKKYIKNNQNERAFELKNVYESFLNLNESVAEFHLAFYVSRIKLLIKNHSLIYLLGSINLNEVISWGCPLVWSLSVDEKNAKLYRNHIELPRLSVYDYTLFIEDTEDDQNTKKYKKLFKKKYFNFITTLFDECVGKENGYKAQDVWDVEYDLLVAMGCNEVKNDSDEFYNKVTKEDALTKYGFDWEEFCKIVGYKEVPDFFICSSLNYLKCVMKLLKDNDNWKSKKWETYFVYIGARQIIRFHKKWKTLFYDFFAEFVTGQSVQAPNEIYAISGLSLCFNTLLTNEYIGEHENKNMIESVNNLGQDLITVFKRIINRNKWLSPSTKKYALLKLKYLKLTVGSPKLLREDPLLNYSSSDPWGNILKITRWRTLKQINLEGEETIDIPTYDWFQFKLIGTQAYVVNAYYTPTQNAIYVPLGYLQKPFIDLVDRGIEYNLAHIGYTLGHEMSHSLDDSGSKYDYNGNLKNWWTDHDRKIFNKKVKDVIKQYETFASYDGIKMDASLGTGEDLADISGLGICVEYLRDYLLKIKDTIPSQALAYKEFFQYIAIQNRENIYDKAIKAQLKINPHPLNKYRTNCPLSRIKLFQSIYNIKKGDKMYWEPTDTIWD